MKFINDKDRVGCSFILVFALVYFYASFDIPLSTLPGNEVFTARTLPMYLSILTIIFCLLRMFFPDNQEDGDSIVAAVKNFRWRPFFWLSGLMLGYSLSFKFLGFGMATVLFLFTGFYILKERRLWLSFLVAAGLTLFMWLILTQLFDIYLDNGDLYRLLKGA